MPFHSIWRCSNTSYTCIMDVWCRVGWFTASTMTPRCHIGSAWPQFFKIWPPLHHHNCVRVHPNAFPRHMKVLKHFICMYYGCVMQFESFYSLNDSVVGSFLHLHHIWFHRTFPDIWGIVCGGNGVSVLPYAHPQLFKVFKHLKYVWRRCGMQFERFYSLNDGVVGSLPHLHYLGFQQTLTNLGKPLWW